MHCLIVQMPNDSTFLRKYSKVVTKSNLIFFELFGSCLGV